MNRDEVAVCAPTVVPYRRYSEHSAAFFFGAALRTMCRSTGLEPVEIDGLAVASLTMGPDSAVDIVAHLGLTPRWLSEITVGGAAGVVALRRAATAVAAGEAETVVCVGADTNRRGGIEAATAEFSAFTRDAIAPYGTGGPNGGFALITQAFMSETGMSAEDFGRLCVASRHNASPNPTALLRKPYSIDEYLGSRMIADPIRLLDCVMPCAGAEAFLVTTRERAARQGLPAVRIGAAFESYNDFPNDPIATRGGWQRHAPALWSAAGLGPEEVDVVQSYDDYPVMVAMQLRDLGFTQGKGIADFVRSNTFTVAGSFPHNTSGGQLSSGQAGFAGGFLGVNETLRQLTETPLGDAVAGARTGLVSGFGMMGYDRGLVSCAALLQRVDA